MPTFTELPSATGNLVLDFYDRLPEIVAACVPDPAPRPGPGGFAPGYALPELDDAVRRYFAAATAAWRPLPGYGGHRLTLLDLALNPGTHTTKTYASLLIVARAVEHIRRTGRGILLFTPTSGNKGVALRDAVLRALEAGLAAPEQLRVATLAPAAGRHKLRATRLSADPRLNSLNPQMSYSGADPESVKPLARAFARDHAADYARRHDLDVWFSLDLSNYMIADAARALFEHRVAPFDRSSAPRLHAHAVSSAFGLLGYHAGRALLSEHRPASLLVQHLAAPDMVLSLRDRAALPGYAQDPGSGLWHREGDDPHYPAVTYDPAEVLDPTFYTHRPPTSPAMNDLITRFGGDGIVVSLAECIGRYPHLRALLGGAGVPLPADLRRLHEWSTVMALTGVLNAIDRHLIPAGRDIVVHGTGHYSDGMYEPLCASSLHPVSTPADIATALEPA